jgi:thermostable 8-oxoguanine DNA glycosylase
MRDAFVHVHNLLILNDKSIPEAYKPEPDWFTFCQLTNAVEGLKDNYQLFRRWSDADRVLVRKHLAFTLFAPGGKATRARKAVLDLDDLGFFDLDSAWDEQEVAEIIRPNVRFYRQKTGRLIRGVCALGDLHDHTCFTPTPTEFVLQRAHDWIQSNIDGLGPKATAHFMRNVGLWSNDFGYPIIDVHIHKMLEVCNCKHGTYKEAELSFQRMAAMTGIPVIYLDAYVWSLYSGSWAPDSADFDNFTNTEGEKDDV